MRDYKKYDVWVKVHQLTLFIYREIILCLPKSEQYDLTSQLKRSSYSVPMNIAEGCGRNTDKDFVHFLDIGLGSLHELEHAMLLCKDLNYIKQSQHEQFLLPETEVKAKLINLIKSIRK